MAEQTTSAETKQQKPAAAAPRKPIQVRQGSFPHIYWIEFSGTLVECAVMKRFDNGDLLYFPVTALDTVDKQRLLKIVGNKNAQLYELWDLMSQTTLGNGMNALSYFQQLTKRMSAFGNDMPVSQGRMGL